MSSRVHEAPPAPLAARIVGVVVGLALAAGPGCRRGGETDEPAAHHYDDKQAALASFEEPERDAWAMPARVVDLLGITPAMDIADIGAGSGYFTRRLATAADSGTIYAVDVDADFKDYIEQHRTLWGTPNIVTRLAVYEHPLLPVGSVDLVFISNTYSFLQDRQAYFTAVFKALRPGGRLAVVDWRVEAQCPRSLGCPKPNQRIPKSTAREELERVGFVVLGEHEFLTYQYFMILGRQIDRDKPPDQPEPGPGPEPEPDGDDSTDAGDDTAVDGGEADPS